MRNKNAKCALEKQYKLVTLGQITQALYNYTGLNRAYVWAKLLLEVRFKYNHCAIAPSSGLNDISLIITTVMEMSF